jgi:hypothetical protein
METTTATWERDGETVVNSGEIDGMEPPQWGPPGSPDEEIVGDYFTSYYKAGLRRAACTYYVVATQTYNQPEVVPAFVIEDMTWVGTWNPELEDMEDTDYSYESASDFFYDTLELAAAAARRIADSDESHVFL